MLILAIDTCSFFYSITLLQEMKVLYEIRSYEKNMQCEELISKIEAILQYNSYRYDDIDLIAVTSGPGTFNGIRIGMSAAYGISLAKGIKITTISTFEIIAYKNKTTRVCFAIDSDMGFLQEFDINFQPISNIVEVQLNELSDQNIVIYDYNTYDNDIVSNSTIAGILASKAKDSATLFYGKQPSIHSKSSDK